MQKKKFKLFDTQREGKGVEKGEDTRPTLLRFFKLFGRKFWKLLTVNLLMLMQVVPLIVCLIAYVAGPTTPTQESVLFAPLLGAQTAEPTSMGATLLNTALSTFRIQTFDTPIYWIIGGLLLLHVVTYGWQKCGAIYIMRNLVRGDGVFVWSDFWHAIKRNWKQGLLMGILDCVVVGVLGLDYLLMSGMPNSFGNNLMFYGVIALAIVYFFMRFYIYLMIVTFDMKISKIFKNALIFTILGIKRNIMAALGMVLMTVIFVGLIILTMPLNLYVTLILPFLCYLAFGAFMYTYAAWPVVQKYMIDPVSKKQDDDSFDVENSSDGEPTQAEIDAAWDAMDAGN